MLFIAMRLYCAAHFLLVYHHLPTANWCGALTCFEHATLKAALPLFATRHYLFLLCHSYTPFSTVNCISSMPARMTLWYGVGWRRYCVFYAPRHARFCTTWFLYHAFALLRAAPSNFCLHHCLIRRIITPQQLTPYLLVLTIASITAHGWTSWFFLGVQTMDYSYWPDEPMRLC